MTGRARRQQRKRARRAAYRHTTLTDAQLDALLAAIELAQPIYPRRSPTVVVFRWHYDLDVPTLRPPVGMFIKAV